MNEDLMSLPGIESALNRLAKVFEPSSQIVKKVFTRCGQVDGGEKHFEPRLWVEVFYVPYPLGVYLLKQAAELYDGDPDATYDVQIINCHHEWQAQETALGAYDLLDGLLRNRVIKANKESVPEPVEDNIPF